MSTIKKISILFIAILSIGVVRVSAQYTVLHTFTGTSTNGAYPRGNLTPSITGDTLYGMTEQGGGAYGYGLVFSIHIDGSAYTDLLDFNGANGQFPYGNITLSITGDTLYGMTQSGGIYAYGNIFSILKNGSGYTDLVDFNGDNGYGPYGSLTRSITGDTLYGMTEQGGYTYSYGNIFSYTLGGLFTDLFDFNGTNGAYPHGNITLSTTGDTLYGMTEAGAAHGDGNIFSIHFDGSTYADIFDFNGTNGANPDGDLTHSITGDTLYGMTEAGAAHGDGNIFSIQRNGSTYADIFDFNTTYGTHPHGNITLSLTGDSLYGMTEDGGAHSRGVLFSIVKNGTGYSNQWNFIASSGVYPGGSVILLKEVLYGMTGADEEGGDGVIFSFSVAPSTLPATKYYCH
jgi:uncharacterized repeat protein (TIGR03803 family)